jgi:hypothetical protein
MVLAAGYRRQSTTYCTLYTVVRDYESGTNLLHLVRIALLEAASRVVGVVGLPSRLHSCT